MPTEVQYAASSGRESRRRVDRGVELLETCRNRRVVLVRAVEPEVETLQDLDVEAAGRVEDVLQPRAAAGQLGHDDRRTGLGCEAETERLCEVAARVTGPMGHLHGHPDVPVPSPLRWGDPRKDCDGCGRGPLAQPVERSRLQGELRLGCRHELAHRHPVALPRQPSEGPDHISAASPVGAAVTGLVPLARTARTRLAGADPVGVGGRSLRTRLLAHGGDLSSAARRLSDASARMKGQVWRNRDARSRPGFFRRR